MYLLDTNVLSEARKRMPDAGVTAWLTAVASADLYLSAITVFEIELGIEKQRRDNPAFAEELANWLGAVLGLYGERVLQLTTGIARRWGRLAAEAGHRELDLAIAATALEHGLSVVTRNVAHYERTGVAIVNPFETRRGSR